MTQNQQKEPSFAKKSLKFIALSAGAVGIAFAVGNITNDTLVPRILFHGMHYKLGFMDYAKCAWEGYTYPIEAVTNSIGKYPGFAALGVEAIGTLMILKSTLKSAFSLFKKDEKKMGFEQQKTNTPKQKPEFDKKRFIENEPEQEPVREQLPVLQQTKQLQINQPTTNHILDTISALREKRKIEEAEVTKIRPI